MERLELMDLDLSEEMSARFQRALDSLWVVYQPIVSLRSKRVCGYESFLRVASIHYQTPLHFISAAVELKKTKEMGRLVRRKVVEDLLSLPGYSDIFLNFHPSEFGADQSGFCFEFEEQSERVVVEIAERGEVDMMALRQRCRELRARGFRIALDDMGAGYASPKKVAELQPDIVKVDMTLVRDIDRHVMKQRIVRSILQMSEDNGIVVVVEGVETAAEQCVLVDMGVDLAQGYRFARPHRRFSEVPSSVYAV